MMAVELIDKPRDFQQSLKRASEHRRTILPVNEFTGIEEN